MTVFYLLNKNFPPPCGRGKSLFSMIQVEVAILMELLALFDTLSVLAVGRVKLVMQMDILFGFSAAGQDLHLSSTYDSCCHSCFRPTGSNAALSLHSLCNLQEARDVRACHVVAGHAILLSSLVTALEDGNHDIVELLVNFLECPAISDGVLAHLKTGSSNAACVCSLCGTVEHLVIEVNFNSIRSRRHVSALCYCIYAVRSEVLSEVAVDLVLGCAGQSDVSLDLSAPNAAFVVLSVLVGGSVYILLDSAALNFLDLLNNIEVDTVRIVDDNRWSRIR